MPTQVLSFGVFAGVCQISTDLFGLSLDVQDSFVTNEEFCLLTQEAYPTSYDFEGVVGFGKPAADDYDSLMETLVGYLWKEQEYAPVVSFDYNFDDMDGQFSFV